MIDLERIAKSIVDEIGEEISRAGIMHRIFYRCKSKNSTDLKIINKGYDGVSTFLRDMIGIRINLYFVDDLPIVRKTMLSRYKKKDEAVDKINQTEFKPTRINYVFDLPEEYKLEFSESINDNRIDNTFELQLRTVLSEGWHEVEHDLRYKHIEHWNNHDDLGRVLNGILASLETNDWTMLSLLDTLSYKHYKSGNWDAMLRTKLRMRLDSSVHLTPDIEKLFQKDHNLVKSIFKLNRGKLLSHLLDSQVKFPLTINNIVYFLNSCYLQCDSINELVPEVMRKTFDQIKDYNLQ
ncbi:ppGpp synthetase/RelA/SpoT-type nucleotidyltransferase [Runella defluvii]|uniref:PpGpp synthetase/RelA/SpoT-type nucleotidyltransferase n=1 Tax=Runella defluvii TaxID=370973 RepID=A0A7W5ZH60_9BACT|nr:hypothetical protein [Runella defluvii]MBB3836829.1 ppGpp synthetase/RelA/SpoT-type nucleotidyltransferase [Runella defluvii]